MKRHLSLLNDVQHIAVRFAAFLLLALVCVALLGCDAQGSAAQPVPVGRHQGRVSAIAFQPKGHLLASTSYSYLAKDDTVRLWDLDSDSSQGQGRVLAGNTGGFDCVAFSPDGRLVAAGGVDSTVHVWDTSLVDPTDVQLAASSFVLSVVFSAQGDLLAAGTLDGRISVWHADDLAGQPLVLDAGTGSQINSLAFSTDASLLLSGSNDHTIRLWRLAGPEHLVKELQLPDGITSLAISPDSRLLVASHYDGSVKLWKMGDLDAQPIELLGGVGSISTVAVSPDSRLVAAGGEDQSVFVWDVSRSVRLWDPKSAPPTRTELAKLPSPVDYLQFSPDGRKLGVANGFVVYLLDVRSDEPR